MEKRNIKNLRIIRVLLSNPSKGLTKYRIAKLAACTRQWVIEFLRKLESRKLVKKTKIMDFDKLVDYYIESMPKSKYSEYFVPDPVKFLKQSKLAYALTTYGAENYTSHHLFPSRYDVYVKKEDIDIWKAIILKNGLLGKGNLRLIMADDEKIFEEAQKINGISIVSISQLLIDLRHEHGVCIEAYNILVERHVQRH
jgi:hypothetical protein